MGTAAATGMGMSTGLGGGIGFGGVIGFGGAIGLGGAIGIVAPAGLGGAIGIAIGRSLPDARRLATRSDSRCTGGAAAAMVLVSGEALAPSSQPRGSLARLPSPSKKMVLASRFSAGDANRPMGPLLIEGAGLTEAAAALSLPLPRAATNKLTPKAATGSQPTAIATATASFDPDAAACMTSAAAAAGAPISGAGASNEGISKDLREGIEGISNEGIDGISNEGVEGISRAGAAVEGSGI